MTDKERATVQAYTGIIMLTGTKSEIYYDYVTKLLGIKVNRSNVRKYLDQIKVKSKPDFLKLCK